MHRNTSSSYYLARKAGEVARRDACDLFRKRRDARVIVQRSKLCTISETKIVAHFGRSTLTRPASSLNSNISSCSPADLSRFAGEVIQVTGMTR